METKDRLETEQGWSGRWGLCMQRPGARSEPEALRGSGDTPGSKPEGPDFRCCPREERGEAGPQRQEGCAGELAGDQEDPFSRSQGIHSAYPEHLLSACVGCQDFRD